jgi:LCP family protein required for cell wall assembly
MTRTTSGKLAKLNSAFGRNNGKENPQEGMENLLLYVKDIVGYKPDGYMLIDLDSFVEIVDLMGGVEFDVPQDMYYEDPTQGLTIDLKKGMQTLNGYEAMGLVRFRKGYANQDLGRVSVQSQFLSACMKQWMKISNIKKLPQVLSTLEENTTTDLSKRNLLWLAVNALRAGIGNVESATLPGKPASRNGASYYILDAAGVANTVNQYCNPYKETITTEHLKIAK